jgi:hypothetical protein
MVVVWVWLAFNLLVLIVVLAKYFLGEFMSRHDGAVHGAYNNRTQGK